MYQYNQYHVLHRVRRQDMPQYTVFTQFFRYDVNFFQIFILKASLYILSASFLVQLFVCQNIKNKKNGRNYPIHVSLLPQFQSKNILSLSLSLYVSLSLIFSLTVLHTGRRYTPLLHICDLSGRKLQQIREIIPLSHWFVKFIRSHLEFCTVYFS